MVSKSSAADLRLSAIHDLPCIACALRGRVHHTAVCGPTEAHHLVDKGYRALSGGHAATIPLGRWHHRGVPFFALTPRMMETLYGPSRELAKKRFVAEFGSDRELLELTDRWLATGELKRSVSPDRADATNKG